MMSLWDALRMNMMISYQELVRTFPTLSNVAGVAANGQFARGGNNADLWNGTWAANPNADNSFAQAYLQAMPAGVLTSQGLAIP